MEEPSQLLTMIAKARAERDRQQEIISNLSAAYKLIAPLGPESVAALDAAIGTGPEDATDVQVIEGQATAVRDLSNCNGVEAAFFTLKDLGNESMRSEQLWYCMLEAGYKSNLPDGRGIAGVGNSCRQRPHIFEPVRRGEFRLQEDVVHLERPPRKKRKPKAGTTARDIVRDCIFKHGPMTVPEILEHTGLNKNTVQNYVNMRDYKCSHTDSHNTPRLWDMTSKDRKAYENEQKIPQRNGQPAKKKTPQT